MQDELVARNSALLEAVFGDRFLRGFEVRFWNGELLQSRDLPAAFTMVLHAPGALRSAFSPPVDLNAGRAFVDGHIDIEGDLERALATLTATSQDRSRAATLHIAYLLSTLPRARGTHEGQARLNGRMHSRERDRAAIAHHYDHPVEFFRSFLGPSMVYSCAYYERPELGLDQAQWAKLDYVLHKLRMHSGMRLLDIGCGWGSLVLRAAERYDAQILGITLSKVQCEFANRRIREAGLEHRARVELRDYRDLGSERFDRIASIGMVEHVGRSHLPLYFSAAYEALEPGGLFLNHGIAEQSPGRTGAKASGFVGNYVFPDGELVSIGDGLKIAERAAFEVRDVENLREHYASTLRAWVANIEAHREAAIATAGITAYRTWRLYMAGSAANFTAGNIGIFQSLLARPRADGSVEIPRTRADLYL